MFDVILKGGRIVDPHNGLDTVGDIAFEGERISMISTHIDAVQAREVIDVQGLTIIPGIIDPHVHISGRYGTAYGCRMMAQVGVTTAIDLGGEGDDMVRIVETNACGLTLGYVHPLIPGYSVSGPEPNEMELAQQIDVALAAGALGIKVLGGHYPLTPQATAAAIELATERSCHVAVHAGTTETGSNIVGMEEAINLSEGRPFHLAHVNSYCRGYIEPPLQEVQRALRALRAAPHVVSESYLATINGTSGRCHEAVPISNVTKQSLKAKGYEPTEDGLRKAIFAGDAQVHIVKGGATQLIGGAEGVEYWQVKQTNVPVSFRVNHPEVTFALACAKEGDRFLVTALGTDGGSMPRNTTVEQGLAMVRYGALSLEDFIRKTSLGPATMFGLHQKADLTEQSDADVTVLDLERGRAVMSFAHGKLVMIDGIVVGEGGRLLVRQTDALDNRITDRVNTYPVALRTAS